MKKKIFLFGALMLSMSIWAATVSVAPGENTLRSAASSAASGDVLQLSAGTYTLTSNLDISTANKVLTIKAADGTSPVISLEGGVIRLRASGVKLTIDGVTIDGSQGGSSIYAIRPYPSSGTLNNAEFIFKNSTLQNVTRGIYAADDVDVTNFKLTIDNCIFKNMMRAVSIGKARLACLYVDIKNSTFMHIGDAENRTLYFAAIDGEEIYQDVDKCEIDHCTFYDCNNTRTVYCPAYNGSHITNCICVFSEAISDGFGYAIYGANSYVKNSIAFKCGIKTSSSAVGENNIMQDALFVDAENGNLQLYANSPAVNAGTDGSTIGDPRWGVSSQSKDITTIPIADRIVKAPYSMSPTTSSVRILWQLSDTVSLGVVKYGTDPSNLNLTAQSRGGWNVTGEGYVHVVELTGLQAFTKYYYQIGDANQWYNQVNSTKTAPNAGTACRIFTISDTHDNSRKIWENMQNYICTLGCDLAMCNGDFVNDGSGRTWNSALFTPGKPFLSQTPFMSSAGNHETDDPLTYRWSTFYDYFSQFSHGTSEDPIKDPRGEGYFGYDYGNARILAVDVNGGPAAPAFNKTSAQYKWLENELQNCTKTWILIFGHVGLTSSGYHGQWPPEYRDDWRALFEKYAAQGKHIIYLCGDDHSFEHAYKDGVHYVRPACGRNSNYAQVKTLADAQYSLFYRQISCYSTLDISADGSTIHMITRDSVGTQFYDYTFKTSGQVIEPSLTFTAPAAETDVVDSTLLQWFVFDPQKDAIVNLYYSQTSGLTSVSGLTAIATNLTASTTRLFWQTRDIFPKGKYYIYATLTSSGKTYVIQCPTAVNLMDDTTPPPAPSDFAGYIDNGHFHLVWSNPTHLIDKERLLTDFSDGISCMQEDSESPASSKLEADNGALKVTYSVGNWNQTSADYVFSEATDCHETPILHFRMKGNGTATDLRIICKNMAFGHEDWWFTESINLSNTAWKDYTLDLSKLEGFDWYANSDTKNKCDGMLRICFAVSTEAQVSGTYYLDDLRLTGQIFPAPDFEKTIIRRSTTGYPTSITDGDAVYEGALETYLDGSSNVGTLYYYSAFALDDRGNVSAPAHWLSSDIISGLDEFIAPQAAATKLLHNGHLFILRHGRVFTALGQDR